MLLAWFLWLGSAYAEQKPNPVCSGLPGPIASTASPSKNRVILISLDGTRPVDLVPENFPDFAPIANRGVVASRMLPSFPTNTFPNHVTLVTGVHPSVHGIVNNRFYDEERGFFAKRDIPGWLETEPIWSILERLGIPTASYHWVGSEGKWPSGCAPRYWKRFSVEASETAKVGQILAWLDIAEKDGRPRLITSWFPGADHVGHEAGPGSPRVGRVLRTQDRALSRLIKGIGERELWDETTLIVVSDHGMAAPVGRVNLEAALGLASIHAEVFGTGGFASVIIYPRHLKKRESINRIIQIARSLGLEAFSREDVPSDARVSNTRFGDVLVCAPVEIALVYRGLSLKGFHGYAPNTEEMSALFVAVGRGAERPLLIDQVESIDVAPTILRLLGVEVPGWMQGTAISELVPESD